MNKSTKRHTKLGTALGFVMGAALLPAVTVYACLATIAPPCHTPGAGVSTVICSGSGTGSGSLSKSGPGGSLGGTVNFVTCSYSDGPGTAIQTTTSVKKGDNGDKFAGLTSCCWTRTFPKACCPTWKPNTSKSSCDYFGLPIYGNYPADGKGGCPASSSGSTGSKGSSR